MKAIILAGGFGTRISEESALRPKPMIEVGGRPILWHILHIYQAHGITDFVICLGYKGYIVKEFFANYFIHQSDVTIDLAQNKIEIHQKYAEPWKVTLVDTGENSMTGGRLKRVKPYIQDDEAFCLTYGDGVGDVDITKCIAQHKAMGKLCTVTVAQPPGRFGAVDLDGTRVNSFVEKPRGDGGYINAGFFVCSPKVCDYIVGDATVWEKEPMENLARDGQMGAFCHRGFWQPMDTLRDKILLEDLWKAGKAPWKTW